MSVTASHAQRPFWHCWRTDPGPLHAVSQGDEPSDWARWRAHGALGTHARGWFLEHVFLKKHRAHAHKHTHARVCTQSLLSNSGRRCSRCPRAAALVRRLVALALGHLLVHRLLALHLAKLLLVVRVLCALELLDPGRRAPHRERLRIFGATRPRPSPSSRRGCRSAHRRAPGPPRPRRGASCPERAGRAPLRPPWASRPGGSRPRRARRSRGGRPRACGSSSDRGQRDVRALHPQPVGVLPVELARE